MDNQKVIVFGVDGLIPELVYKFSSEGYLPNISKMMKEGATSELLPFISTWGDVNWISFLTGQAPGNAWKGQTKSSASKENLIGLADIEGKKCALVHFPQSLSVEGTIHYSFAPFYGGTSAPSFELASPRVYSTNLNKWPVKEKKESLGWPPTDTIAHHEKNNRSSIENLNNQYNFKIHLNDRREKDVSIEPLDGKNVRLYINKNSIADIELNKWSDWINVNFDEEQEGTVRFKLVKYDAEKREIDIIQSQINRVNGLSENRSIEEYLLKKCGPFLSVWTVKASADELYNETSFEEGEYQAMWLADAALGLIKDKEVDLFATVFRLNDETHHTSLGQYDPSSPFYAKEKSSIYEETMRKSYEVLDRAIGKILDEKTKDTTLILASDHGNVPNHYFCDIYRRLEEFDLCELDERGNPVLDKSKAYLKEERGGLEVFVNLKGRENNGIVLKEEYDSIQEKIFQALSGWTHNVEGNPQNVTALTLKKQDASSIGYWGPEMGDVIFAYSQGFVWGTNKRDAVAPVSVASANHGPQIPSAKTSHSSNQGIIVLHGSNNKAGYKHNVEQFGPYLMSDAGKTISQLLGIQDTSTLDGKLMSKLFNS